MLPSDLDGTIPPPVGSSNYFMNFDDDAWGYSPDQLQLWAFQVDWAVPANSTFTNSTILDLTALGYPFASVCNDFFRGQCITQPSPGEVLESLGDRLMHRLAYRNFGSHESLVVNHSVDVYGADHSGIRWYEIRDPGGAPTLYQAGTYGPDSDHRWMGSIAMDHVGNIAVGYSVSSVDTYPSVRYAGRLAGDPLGELTQGEAELIAGAGSQIFSSSRWGDYSSMSVDPQDDCTFWYTQEYYANTEAFDFKTRIGSFKFPSCSIGPQGILTGTVTDVDTSAPIAGASISASLSPTLTIGTTSNATGGYSVYLPVGTYTATASAYGYFPTSVSGLSILSGTTTTQDFALTPLPSAVVNGTVTDGSDHADMPLYAQINVTAPGFADVIFTDPVTGAYNTTLFLNQPYSFTVSAVGGGYDGTTVNVTPTTDPFTQDFVLTVSAVCTAAGYEIVGGLLETFESGALPAGWSIVDNLGNDQVWEFDDPGGRGNLTGGTGLFAIMDSDHWGPSGSQDTELWTPVLDFTGQTTVTLQFDSDYFNLGDTADVDVSNNSGSTWTNVWQRTADERGPYHATINIAALAANQNDVVVRFHNYNAFWAWWWEVDNVSVGNLVCDPVVGGRIVGNVYDANTGGALNGASVTDGAKSVTSFATPLDDAQDDGFYIFFGPAAATTITATLAGGYAPDAHDVTAVTDSVVAQDFNLGAGFLSYVPPALQATVDLGDSTTLPFTLTNSGAGAATFELKERDNGFVPNIVGVVRPIPEGVGRDTGGAHTPFHSPAPVGPLSIRSLDKGIGQGHQSSAPAAWTNAADIPEGVVRYAHAQCSDEPDSFYVIGGVDESFSLTDNVWRYDAEVDTWMALAPFPEPQEGPIAVCDEGFIYVMGGGGTDQYYIYDIANDSWSTGANLPRNVWGAAAGAWDGQIFLIGGDDDFFFGGTSDEVNIYDIANETWIGDGASMPTATSAMGFVQGGQYIYVVGGWDDGSPASNVDVSQRYDMSSDTWETGPTFTSARADFALAITNDNLYAMGGDADSGGPFDASDTVEMLDHTAWPGGAWADAGDPLPTDLTSNNAGFCTESFTGGEVWSVSGINSSFSIVVDNQYRQAESCFKAGGNDAIWLSEAPVTGTASATGDQSITITFDASVIQQPGDYVAELRIIDNTPYEALANVPVTMTVPVPSGWGQAHGRAYGLGYCDSNPIVLDGATIDLTTSTGVTGTLTQDGDAPWSWWAPAGPLTVTVSADGYVSQTVVLNLVAGQGTNEDTNLRWLHNCGSVSPTTVELSPQINTLSAVPVSLVNSGTVSWTWSLSESSSWLSISGASSGTTDADSSSASELTINTSGMLLGTTYTAILYVTHDDDLAPSPMSVLVRVTVSSEVKLYMPVLQK
jgi:hypothetical protein